MLQVGPQAWAKPVEHELEALMDAISDADLAIHDALRKQNPASEELTRFSSRFSTAQDQLIRVLLDAFCELDAT